MDRRQKTNSLQWSVFLDYAENHPEILTKKFETINGKRRYNELWSEITNALNSLGYLQKSTEKWQKAVTDWKCKVRAKAADINRGLTKTGGGGPLPPLSDNEKRLLAIIGWNSVTGTDTVELGFTSSTIIEGIQPENATANVSPSTSRPKMGSPIILNILENNPTRNSDNIQENYLADGPANISPPPLVFLDSAKHKLQEISQSAPQVENNTRKRKKVIRTRQPVPSNSISEMHMETLTVLKNINENLSRMANTQEQIIIHLTKKQTEGNP